MKSLAIDGTVADQATMSLIKADLLITMNVENNKNYALKLEHSAMRLLGFLEREITPELHEEYLSMIRKALAGTYAPLSELNLEMLATDIYMDLLKVLRGIDPYRRNRPKQTEGNG